MLLKNIRFDSINEFFLQKTDRYDEPGAAVNEEINRCRRRSSFFAALIDI